MNELTKGNGDTCCGSAARDAAPGGPARTGRLVAAGMIALSCAVACAAAAGAALLWPVALVLAGLGGWRAVAARGCAPAPGAADADAPLDPSARAARRRGGLGFLAAAVALGGGALAGLALLWPLALLAGWFGASFLVASATGYAGCPEIGAIPSLLTRRPIATSCPPLDRLDGRRASGEARDAAG